MNAFSKVEKIATKVVVKLLGINCDLLARGRVAFSYICTLVQSQMAQRSLCPFPVCYLVFRFQFVFAASSASALIGKRENDMKRSRGSFMV